MRRSILVDGLDQPGNNKLFMVCHHVDAPFPDTLPHSKAET
jgi:hypothetical protein